MDDGFVTGGDPNGDFNDELFERFTKAIEQILPDVDYRVLLLRSNYQCSHPKRIWILLAVILNLGGRIAITGGELFQREGISLAKRL